MKNLFAKISLFQLSDSLVQPQPQGAYVISINKIRSEQKREPHHLTYTSTLRPRYRYYILKRRISICAWFEFGANKFQDDSRSRGQVLQTHIKQIYTLFRPLYQYTSNSLDDYPILYRIQQVLDYRGLNERDLCNTGINISNLVRRMFLKSQSQ